MDISPSELRKLVEEDVKQEALKISSISRMTNLWCAIANRNNRIKMVEFPFPIYAVCTRESTNVGKNKQEIKSGTMISYQYRPENQGRISRSL